VLWAPNTYVGASNIEHGQHHCVVGHGGGAIRAGVGGVIKHGGQVTTLCGGT
jgi:hypothetical protein